MKKATLLRLLRVMARFCVLSLGVFMVLLVGAFILSYYFSGRLIQYYSRQLENNLNVNVSIHKSSLSGRTLTLEGVQIQTKGGAPLVRIDRVVAPLSPYEGLRYGAARWVSDVRLTRPQFNVNFASDGRLNWDSVTLPRRLADRPLEMSYRGHILVEDGSVSMRDQRQGDYLAHLNQINGSLSWEPNNNWSAQGDAQRKSIDFQVAAQPDKPIVLDLNLKQLAMDDFLVHPTLMSQVRVEGSVANGDIQLRLTPENFADTMVFGKIQIAAQEMVVPQVAQTFRALSGHFHLLGSAVRIEGAQLSWNNLLFHLQGEVRPGAESSQNPWIKLKVQSASIQLERLAKINPKLPTLKGMARLDVVLEGPLEEPNLRGRLQASNVEAERVRLRDALADFELDSNSLHLRRLLAHTPEGQELQGHGWIFRDKNERIFLRLSGLGAAQLGRLSPWLAGADQVDVTALGSLLDPVLTGHASLTSLPANPLALSRGHSQFWADRQSALLWNGNLSGSGGQLAVPWAVVDYHTGQIAAEAVCQDYQVSTAQGTARVHGQAAFSGNYQTGQYQGLAYLDDSQIQAQGLPAMDNVSGVVGYQQGELLVPQLSMTSAGDALTVTGSLQNGQGAFFLDAPQFNAQQWFTAAPSGPRNLTAMAEVHGTQVDGFRAATRGVGGDAYAVGRWLPGRAPEFFAQFVNAQIPNQTVRLDGQLATAWQGGRLNYYYGLRPGGAPEQNWLAGNGWLNGNTLQMVDNFLHMPETAQAAVAWGGEGRAYSYFGPEQGPPLQAVASAPQPWQSGGTLSWNGGFDLRDTRLNNVKVRGRNLNLRQLNSWFGPLQTPPWWQQFGVKLEDVLVDVDGQAQGSLRAPQWTASLRSPWTRLSRVSDQEPESAAFSWRAEAKYKQGQLELLSLLSPHSQDQKLLTWKGPRTSPPEADWLRSRMQLGSNMAWKGWLRAEAFPIATARWLAPGWIADKLPSGVLSTQGDGLQVGGTLYDPQLAGRVDLRRGRFWTGFGYVPIDEAYVDFASRRNATALSRLHLKSAGLTLDGRGNRTSDGSLTAQLWADDLSLDTLNQFGWNTNGWKGTVDMAFSFRDARGVAPEGWLALQGNDLRPATEGAFGIRRLVLGAVDRELDGIPFTGPGKGIAFRLANGEVVVDVPSQGAEIVWDTPTPSRALADGQISWRLAPAFNQTLPDWLTSKDGPRFGRVGQPLKLEIQQVGWQLIKQLFALLPDEREGLVSGSLELLGQYYEQHRVKNPKVTGKPLLTAQLSELLLEGPGASWSGVQLRQPLKLAYEVVPGAGWLRLEPATLEFFHKLSKDSPKLVQGTLNLEAHGVAMENPGLKKTASLSPNQQLKASLQDLPVANLSFLFPGLTRVGGLIKNLDFTQEGPISQPDAHLSVSAQNLQIQGLNITAAQGLADLTGETPGRMRLSFGEGADELRFLLGAENDLTQSLRFQGQALLDFDRVVLMKSPVLVGSLSGWSLTDKSEFDLRAQLNDSQMRLLSAIAPDQSQLSGSLKGGLQLSGTSAKPELTGTLALENGGFSHPNLTTPLGGVNMLARFERIDSSDAEASEALKQIGDRKLGRYTLEKLEGSLGGQPFQGKGKAELAGRLPTFLDFHFDGDELPIHWDGLMDGRANVHLALSGTAQETGGLKPYLTGRIDVPQANLWLPDEKTLAPLLALSSNKSLLDYNLDLGLGNDVFGSYLGSSIRATGDLNITPSRTSKRPAINGSLFLSRGVIRIPVYEISFRVRQGYAYFENDFMPRIENLEADSTLGNYQITARFDGKYPNLRADLVSNPPLPESNLRRLVGLESMPGSSSNTLASNSFSTNANSLLVNQGVSMLSNMLTGALTQQLGKLLFASEVSFDILPTSEYVVRVAKSLDEHDTFLLTFAQVIGATRFNQTYSQYGLEWRFQPNLLTRFTLNNYGQAQLWFQGVLRFESLTQPRQRPPEGGAQPTQVK